jgi:glutamate dehydrogenase
MTQFTEQERADRLEQILDVLRQQASPEDRDLVLALAPILFAAMPPRTGLEMPVETVANRILLLHYPFIARDLPPAHQLYRGLPGIHVGAARLREEESRRIGGGAGLPLETTVLCTHTPDLPFIFRSLKSYLQKSGLRVYAALHPMFTVQRQWERIRSFGDAQAEGNKEIYCLFHLEPVQSREQLRRIEREVFSLLKAVFLAVDGFKDMSRACRDLVPRLRTRHGDEGELASSRDFLEWLLAGNYVFAGSLTYASGPDGRLAPVDETAAGVFSDPALLPVVFPGVVESIEERLEPRPGDDRILDLDFCADASAIHQLEPVQILMVRSWREDGTLGGVTVLLGRFARGAMERPADAIPLLKEKHDRILARYGGIPDSPAWRETHVAFNRFPKIDLFYAGERDLGRVIAAIGEVVSDEDLVVDSRRGAGYEVLYLAFSRLRHSHQTEVDLQRAYEHAFGPVAFTTSVDFGPVTLLIFYFDAARLEHPLDPAQARQLTEPVITSWEDRAAQALEREFGEREGRRLFRRYVTPESRSGLYREATVPEQVPTDVRQLEALESRLEVRVTSTADQTPLVQLCSRRTLDLTDTLKTMQNLGLTVTDEQRIPLTLPDGRRCQLYRFEIAAPPERIEALAEGEQRFVEALRALDEEQATDDPLNGLILSAGLSWRDVEVLRTLRNHLLQIRPHWNADTVNGVLVRNSSSAGALLRSFAARFDPALPGDRAAAVAQADADFSHALDSVSNLAEDEVLRALANLLRAVVRTNSYQRPERPVFAIKIDCSAVEAMPSPRPLFEIYVHSRRLEGVHLRGGKVARGGIRWSDRHDDFRTEVLGLMKTQMVKNSVIVPLGSKGGFVLKGDVPARPALDEYLVVRYREYVSGLLDVTDSRSDGVVLHPPEVVRLDGDDPYLVVAADKGTAHLSDTANSASAQYGFWLADAFASGGSAGYDHKKMGITARGAWECVRHHFRNLGVDVQTDPITVAGIGDMSGDVFGNGVLLSRTIRLVAAFDHRHIFLDPDPDPAVSFQERQRMFALERSSWREYDASLLSKGGGVYDRSAKAIELSDEARRLLDIEAKAPSGEEVIRKILTARVDLLYNGGVGTYVKSATEANDQVSDHANDRVRVHGDELRARVVAEGGNLGLTQKGRLDYAAGGGRLNTDAVDNSGGVDTSDHEVNIKILLDMLVKQGLIADRDERNHILKAMTNDVAELVLADNAGQALALSLDGLRSARRYEEFVGLIDELVKTGQLNRQDESVPSKDALLTSPRRALGLPRPLLCVLLGYSKMLAFRQLLETGFPDSPAGRPFLTAYFPRLLRERFVDHFERHVLRREIVATVVVNDLINRGGIALLPGLMRKAATGIGEAVAAWIEVDRETQAQALRDRLLAAGRPAAEEQEALVEIEDVVEAAALARLQGSGGQDAAGALAAIAGRLGLATAHKARGRR